MTWAAFGAIAGLAGTGLSAIGALQSAAANQASATYQAQVAQNNATIAAQNAQYASEAGNEQIQAQQLKQREAEGTVAAAMAANGLDVTSGSPAAVRRSEAATTQLDVGQTAQNAALQIYGFKTQSTNYAAQSGLDTLEAANAAAAGPIAAGSSLLSGVGGVASRYALYQTDTSPGYYGGGGIYGGGSDN